MWARDALEFFKQNQRSSSGESSEEQNTDRNVNCVCEVSDGNKDSWVLDCKPCMLHFGKEVVSILSMP
jgi:hypothetical protein